MKLLGIVKDALMLLGIEERSGAPYHPQSQGKVERSHGTWKKKLFYDLADKGGISIVIATPVAVQRFIMGHQI